MAKITLNEFVKRSTRIGISFIFDDYRTAKQQAKTKGKIRLKTGGELPTPNEVIRKLVAEMEGKKMNGDYHLKSEGAIQTLMLTDANDAKPFITTTAPLLRADGRPLTNIIPVHVSMERHVAMAQRLGLL